MVAGIIMVLYGFRLRGPAILGDHGIYLGVKLHGPNLPGDTDVGPKMSITESSLLGFQTAQNLVLFTSFTLRVQGPK